VPRNCPAIRGHRDLTAWRQSFRNRARLKEMGFLFYASFVRFVLEGGYGHVLAERARVWMKAAGIVPPEE
jgi:hypothetical protein